MQHKRIALGFLAALAGLTNAEDASDVTQLTEKTFKEFVGANDLVLAECKLPHIFAFPSLTQPPLLHCTSGCKHPCSHRLL